MDKKFVSLSKKNLKKVWDWAEEHPDSKIANAYMELCSAIGFLDLVNPFHFFDNQEETKSFFEAESSLFEFRDRIGRKILSNITAASKL